MKKITVDQLNHLINYLITKPYGETFKLINMIYALPDVKSAKKEKPKKDEK